MTMYPIMGNSRFAGVQLTVGTPFTAKKQQSTTPIIEIKDKEKKKKRLKKSLIVGGGVLGISAVVTLFNPHFSTKLIENLKHFQNNTKQLAKKNKDDFLASKFYKALSGCVNWCSRFLSYTNNGNSLKDTYFKKLCTEQKSFSNVRNKKHRNILLKADKIFLKIFKKPHEFLTKIGDKLAKLTVKNCYKNSAKQITNFENFINTHKQNLSAEQLQTINTKLEELSKYKSYLDKEQVEKRLFKQEQCMSTLNSDIRNYWQKYRQGFVNNYVENRQHFDNNLSFWAQDMLQPKKNEIIKNGNKFVTDVLGNQETNSGGYKDIYNILQKNLNEQDKKQLEKYYKKMEKSLQSSNKNECIEYFDKKRDLVLGSAPTDIVTGLLTLMGCGCLIATTDDKDKKISRLITGVIPTVLGFVSSIALTSMLVSGITSMVLGGVIGFGFNIIGSQINKARLRAKGKSEEMIEMEMDDV